jgi:hypothetical protein
MALAMASGETDIQAPLGKGIGPAGGNKRGLARAARRVKQGAFALRAARSIEGVAGVHEEREAMAEAGGRLDVAVQRLERALTMLDQRLARRLAEAGADAGGLFDQDRAKLAADLDASRARERELEEAGAEASQALGRAISALRGQAEGA